MCPDHGDSLQLAFLTGQSDPARCALSPTQRAFGEALLAPGRWLQPLNFPYRPHTPPHRAVPLLRASWHNSLQYLLSRRPAFAREHQRDMQALVQAAPHTVLLAGSCGLELLANLALPDETLARLSVFAYGPVARHSPTVARLQAITGRHDWLSRLGWQGDATLVRGGHLGYLERPDVLALARHFVDQTQAALR